MYSADASRTPGTRTAGSAAREHASDGRGILRASRTVRRYVRRDGSTIITRRITKMIPVNFGWYREEFPPAVRGDAEKMSIPKARVELRAHGVGRWYRDCGCSTGGGPAGIRNGAPLPRCDEFLKGKADAVFVREFPNFPARPQEAHQPLRGGAHCALGRYEKARRSSPGFSKNPSWRRTARMRSGFWNRKVLSVQLHELRLVLHRYRGSGTGAEHARRVDGTAEASPIMTRCAGVPPILARATEMSIR